MDKCIFLDFDGTLVDSRLRLYTLFRELVPESTFSFEEYWRIKRRKISQRDVLFKYFNYTEDQIAIVKKAWMSKVEEPARLLLDLPFAGVSDLLDRLSHEMELHVVTARQSSDLVKSQVHQFGWSSFFTNILITQQRQTKESLIRPMMLAGNINVFVGDTGEDILSGKALGMKTIAVSSGVLDAEVLKEYQPDYLMENIVTCENLLRTIR